jgi:transposase-like protein
LGPSLFIIYINDLTKIINNFANSVLFADDTSVIITNTDAQEFKHNIDVVLQEITNWFLSNVLTLNYNKTQFLQFFAKKPNEIKKQIITTNTILIVRNF